MTCCSKLQKAPEVGDATTDGLSRLYASAREIDARINHATASVEREMTDKEIMLNHIERYAITPFGYFPPLI